MSEDRHPRSNQGSNPLDWIGGNEWEQIAVLKILVLLAVTAVPVMVVTLWRSAESWMLRHELLVPATRALVTIPTWEAGLDAQRLIVAGLLGLSVLCLLVHLPDSEERAA